MCIKNEVNNKLTTSTKNVLNLLLKNNKIFNNKMKNRK